MDVAVLPGVRLVCKSIKSIGINNSIEKIVLTPALKVDDSQVFIPLQAKCRTY
jgi:hypothetical protein